MGRPGIVSLFQVRLTRPVTPEAAAGVKARLAAISPLLDVSDSAEFAGNMQFERTLGTIASAVSLVMMILASSILVANTLVMSVSERRQEFGILAAIGWTPGMIRVLVVAEG
ncbi:MAG: hypothetical protein IPL38_09420 [Rhodobacter sp.]|nr:hypothetical protein [Rhodobacter sp.]